MKIYPTLSMEKALWEQGFLIVAGVDEAGRGAWAGPVMAGAVILPRADDLATRLRGVCDSKLLTAREREAEACRIRETALSWAVGSADHAEIDRMGILPATRLAMSRAIEQLAPPPDQLLIDYVRLPMQRVPQQCIAKGDRLSLSIASASILAKVARDRWMVEVAEAAYPGYGFAQHKGYGTRMHQRALKELGPCAIHRMTFRPLAKELQLF